MATITPAISDILMPFIEEDIFEDPNQAFKAVKNKYFDLSIPYSHLIIFSSENYESAVYELRKALNLPYFHTMGPNGKSVFIDIKGKTRLVVDFLFEYQIEERIQHYGNMLSFYLKTAETVNNFS